MVTRVNSCFPTEKRFSPFYDVEKLNAGYETLTIRGRASGYCLYCLYRQRRPSAAGLSPVSLARGKSGTWPNRRQAYVRAQRVYTCRPPGSGRHRPPKRRRAGRTRFSRLIQGRRGRRATLGEGETTPQRLVNVHPGGTNYPQSTVHRKNSSGLRVSTDYKNTKRVVLTVELNTSISYSFMYSCSNLTIYISSFLLVV